MPTPEAQARQKIDELLIAAGWLLQDYKALNLGADQGIALREVPLDFDAHLVGLTATPSKQTDGCFQQNLVMGSGTRKRHRPPNRRFARRASVCARQYTHERAVADSVNVGYEVYRIKETRARCLALLDEDLPFATNDLDRSVVVESQIRTVLTAYRDALGTDLFPGRMLVPKTLIFAKDDSHAEDIVHLVRQVFGRGNDFAKKITYKSYDPETKRYERSENLIAVRRPRLRPTSIRRRRTRRVGVADTFRTSPTLRIAVTVDMIATDTDIKPLEVLLFLRDVLNRVHFEQMKGRGTRVLTPTDLQAVSGEDARAKSFPELHQHAA